MVKNLLEVQETWVQSMNWEGSHGEGNGLPTAVFLPGEFHGRGGW